jgi:hypothetical protein
VLTFRGAGWNVDDVRVCARARETSMQRWSECAVGTRALVVVAIGVVATDFALADLPFLK